MEKGAVLRFSNQNDHPVVCTIAEVLCDLDDKSRQTNNGIARDATRWNEITVARTVRGKIVVKRAYRTRWQGERDSVTWCVYADVTSAACALADSGDRLDKEALEECGWWDNVAEAA